MVSRGHPTARSKAYVHNGACGMSQLTLSSPATIQAQLIAPPWEAKPGLRHPLLSRPPQCTGWRGARSLNKAPRACSGRGRGSLPPLPPSRVGSLQPGKHRMLMKQALRIGQRWSQPSSGQQTAPRGERVMPGPAAPSCARPQGQQHHCAPSCRL